MRVCVVVQEDSIPYLEAILGSLTSILNAICKVSYNYRVSLKNKQIMCFKIESLKTTFQSLLIRNIWCFDQINLLIEPKTNRWI